MRFKSVQVLPHDIFKPLRNSPLKCLKFHQCGLQNIGNFLAYIAQMNLVVSEFKNLWVLFLHIKIYNRSNWRTVPQNNAITEHDIYMISCPRSDLEDTLNWLYIEDRKWITFMRLSRNCLQQLTNIDKITINIMSLVSIYNYN